MKKSTLQLTEYSLLAMGIFGTQSDLKSQVIYTDIEPDIVIDSPGEYASLDIDNNFYEDFTFLFDVSYFTNSSSLGYEFDYFTRTAIWVGWNNTSVNEIAGTYQSGPFGSWIRYYPYALEAGDVIKEGGVGLHFQNWGAQRMAFKSGSDGAFSDEGGYWYPEVEDHYVGVHFLDATEKFHYGWIRCSVIDSGEVLIIKDYAFELQEETKILAGDTIGDTTSDVIEEINLLGATVYSFGNTITIQLHQLYPNTIAFIYDLSGKKLREYFLTNKFTSIQLYEPPGIYLIEIISEDKLYTKKLYVQ